MNASAGGLQNSQYGGGGYGNVPQAATAEGPIPATLQLLPLYSMSMQVRDNDN
jgi:hypothetical protein